MNAPVCGLLHLLRTNPRSASIPENHGVVSFGREKGTSLISKGMDITDIGREGKKEGTSLISTVCGGKEPGDGHVNA